MKFVAAAGEHPLVKCCVIEQTSQSILVELSTKNTHHNVVKCFCADVSKYFVFHVVSYP